MKLSLSNCTDVDGEPRKEPASSDGCNSDASEQLKSSKVNSEKGTRHNSNDDSTEVSSTLETFYYDWEDKKVSAKDTTHSSVADSKSDEVMCVSMAASESSTEDADDTRKAQLKLHSQREENNQNVLRNNPQSEATDESDSNNDVAPGKNSGYQSTVDIEKASDALGSVESQSLAKRYKPGGFSDDESTRDKLAFDKSQSLAGLANVESTADKQNSNNSQSILDRFIERIKGDIMQRGYDFAKVSGSVEKSVSSNKSLALMDHRELKEAADVKPTGDSEVAQTYHSKRCTCP
jgi:hypothetical protein